MGSSARAEEPEVTYVFSFIYGYGPLKVGDEVTVHTAKGVLCGKTRVTVVGQYGLMPVYGDIPLTKNLTEGARVGEELIIKINGKKVNFSKGQEPTASPERETNRIDLK